MILISHRGNLNGREPEKENNPAYISNAINKGFEVEIDVWLKDNIWYLGHDSPTYEIAFDWLRNKKVWCHAKNIEALNILLKNDIHCFWHQEDDVTLTSCGFMWTYPEKTLTDTSIAVVLEKYSGIPKKCVGICSDYIITYNNNIGD
tara:strand:+ start:218 stop:658 length:441 start_codon:yes stop_codon:yes gene_type:complete